MSVLANYYREIILFFFLSWDGVGVGIKFEISAVETAGCIQLLQMGLATFTMCGPQAMGALRRPCPFFFPPDPSSKRSLVAIGVMKHRAMSGHTGDAVPPQLTYPDPGSPASGRTAMESPPARTLSWGLPGPVFPANFPAASREPNFGPPNPESPSLSLHPACPPAPRAGRWSRAASRERERAALVLVTVVSATATRR